MTAHPYDIVADPFVTPLAYQPKTIQEVRLTNPTFQTDFNHVRHLRPIHDHIIKAEEIKLRKSGQNESERNSLNLTKTRIGFSGGGQTIISSGRVTSSPFDNSAFINPTTYRNRDIIFHETWTNVPTTPPAEIETVDKPEVRHRSALKYAAETPLVYVVPGEQPRQYVAYPEPTSVQFINRNNEQKNSLTESELRNNLGKELRQNLDNVYNSEGSQTEWLPIEGTGLYSRENKTFHDPLKTVSSDVEGNEKQVRPKISKPEITTEPTTQKFVNKDFYVSEKTVDGKTSSDDRDRPLLVEHTFTAVQTQPAKTNPEGLYQNLKQIPAKTLLNARLPDDNDFNDEQSQIRGLNAAAHKFR